ncbi:MAG: serine--tRNA ligase [Proteobacteria bacterium]|nr:serine--tRNA ligase [Pseudomonadota bacterium]
MFDLRWIREHPDAFDRSLVRRGDQPLSEQVLGLDAQRRGAQTRLQEMQEQRNAASKQIGAAMQEGRKDEAEQLKTEVGAIKGQMEAVEAEEKQAAEALNELLSGIPNVLDDDVPDGADEADNREVRVVGEVPVLGFMPKEHFEIGEALGLMDFETAAEISGSRFVILKGALARMERALADFMLDIHTDEYGYTEISPPLLVRDDVLFGTGQLPKFADDLFRTEDGRWLIPTAEVPLTNMVAGKILDAGELPFRVTAHTSCFRAEAGAAGRDTRGMLRQHQFYKVELVSVVAPDESDAELERMTGCAEEVLKRLGLPYRLVVLCSGDTGFGAAKTHDIEVWMPGQATYREISSCSNTRAFQARRMNARYRPAGEGQGPEHVHTLNGSGVAIGRALIAILENFQNEDGSVTVPEALRPYMAGLEVIRADV